MYAQIWQYSGWSCCGPLRPSVTVVYVKVTVSLSPRSTVRVTLSQKKAQITQRAIWQRAREAGGSGHRDGCNSIWRLLLGPDLQAVCSLSPPGEKIRCILLMCSSLNGGL